MEKFLLASTALVASATFAFAEVNVSGTAEMGVFGASEDLFNDDNDDIEDADLQFHTDIDVIFTMAGETDQGLAFGAEVDLDDVVGDQLGAEPLGLVHAVIVAAVGISKSV